MDDFDIPSISQFEVLFAIEEAFDVELPEEPKDLTLGGLGGNLRLGNFGFFREICRKGRRGNDVFATGYY